MTTFDDALREMLAQKGIILDRMGKLHLDPSHTASDAPTQAQLDYLNEKQGSHRSHSDILLQWAENLFHTVQRLATGNSTDAFALRAVFFLRIHGFLVDFMKEYSLAENARNAQPRPGTNLHYFRAVVTAVDDMRNALTEDEQLYAEYRRHADAHIWQGAYEIKWNQKKDAVHDQSTSKFTGKVYQTQDLTNLIDATIRRYPNEAAIADDFARRLLPHAARLLTAVREFCTPKI